MIAFGWRDLQQARSRTGHAGKHRRSDQTAVVNTGARLVDHHQTEQTRLISRKLQLVPGQTVAFSGLLEPQLAALSRDIPGLQQLPVIGRLFDSEAYLEGFSDLVLLLTAQAPLPAKQSRQSQPEIAPEAGALYLMGHDWQPVSRAELEAPLVALPEAFERAAVNDGKGRFGHVIN